MRQVPVFVEFVAMAAGSKSMNGEISSDPAVRNGEAVVRGTTTPVRAIAELWNQGMAPEEIPIHLPHLEMKQVFAALYFYLENRQEIDRHIIANRIPEQWSGKQFDPASRTVK